MQLLGLAAVGVAAFIARDMDAWPIIHADYATATGETRDIVLADGTRIVLDTGTSIDVCFNEQERRIILRSGEILVTTAHDAAPAPRSFLVQSRQGTVQALGTRFTVRQDDDLSQVAVFEGAVRIRPLDAQDTDLTMPAGYRTEFSSQQIRQPLLPAEETAAAWSQGLLVAEQMRVGDFVAELARYRSGILRCDPDVADLRVTGVFSLRDTDRALANLTLALPVGIAYRTRYWVTVSAR